MPYRDPEIRKNSQKVSLQTLSLYVCVSILCVLKSNFWFGCGVATGIPATLSLLKRDFIDRTMAYFPKVVLHIFLSELASELLLVPLSSMQQPPPTVSNPGKSFD